MIITIAGKPGSGKSTVAKTLAKKMGYSHFSAGDFQRELAAEHQMDIKSWVKYLETHAELNNMVDARTAKLGREKDNFVMDAHIAWKFIPHSFKVFLDVDITVAAKRVYDAGRNDEKYASLQAARNALEERAASEQQQYRAQYGVDIFDQKNYDAVIDTSKLTVEQTMQKVLALIKR